MIFSFSRRSTNYKTRSRGKEVSTIIQRPGSPLHVLRDLTKSRVCYVLWIKGAAMYSRTELEHGWGKDSRMLGQIKHGAGFDRLISSPKWLLVPHPARQYQPANPAPHFLIPASVLFDLIVRASQHSRSRWSFAFIEMETSLSTTLQPFFMSQGWDDAFFRDRNSDFFISV